MKDDRGSQSRSECRSWSPAVGKEPGGLRCLLPADSPRHQGDEGEFAEESPDSASFFLWLAKTRYYRHRFSITEAPVLELTGDPICTIGSRRHPGKRNVQYRESPIASNPQMFPDCLTSHCTRASQADEPITMDARVICIGEVALRAMLQKIYINSDANILYFQIHHDILGSLSWRMSGTPSQRVSSGFVRIG